MKAATRTPAPEDTPSRPRRTGVITTVVVAAVVVVGIVLAATLVRPAGPTPAVVYRALVGGGSATTGDVLAALGEGIPELGPVAAGAEGPVVTKDPEVNAACTLPRPVGDAAGLAALVAQQAAAPGPDDVPCLDFAHSTVDPSAVPDLAGLTWIPFGRDAVTFAQRADSPNPRALTTAQLRAVYTCADPAYLPQLPASGSGLRTRFLAALGLADTTDFGTANPCVSEIAAGGPESSGQSLVDPRAITPYSVAQYVAQTTGTVRDMHGSAVLGTVDGVTPVVATSPSAVGLAQRQDSPIGEATVEQVRAVYTCSAPAGAQSRFAPLLPAYGSAVRSEFLRTVGLADAADYTVTYPCVSDTDAGGAPLPENTGTILTERGHIAPYSVEQYLAQVQGSVPDVHGATLLRPLGDTGGSGLNPEFPLVHDVYTVVPTSRLEQAPTSAVLVGAGSAVCRSADTIARYGFLTAPNCGDASLRSTR